MRLLAFLACVQGCVHVWHRVQSDESAWCQLSPALEYDYWFSDLLKTNITNFTLDGSFLFGMSLGPTADFNMMYTVACVPLGAVGLGVPKTIFAIAPLGLGVPKTIFAIGVGAPGRPVLSTLNYDGAASTAEYHAPIVELFIRFST